MERTYASKAHEKIGQKVLMKGWVHILRDHGKIAFIILRDVTGMLQAVVTNDNEDVFKNVKAVTHESVVALEGEIKEQKQAPQGIELAVDAIEVLSVADAELPIPVVEKGQNETDQSLRLDYRWIDLRKPEKLLEFKVASAIEKAFGDFLRENGFLQIHSPKLMNTPSESGAEVFEVKYFDRKAYLAQSPQFYKQMGMAAGFERVFEVGPVFRAEPSFTSRHATEFTGFDLEMSFIDSPDDVMQMIERLMEYILKEVKKEYGEEIMKVFGREIEVPKLPFPRVPMKEAKAMLAPLKIESEKEGDLNQEEETKLCELVKEKYKNEFVFVTEYPAEVRAFYHMRKKDRPDITKSFDLLWNGIEISTGAQREHRYDVLVDQAVEKGLRLEPLQSYLDFFKYGCPPEGGCGIGMERVLMKVLNLSNIREATYLPRTVHRLTP